MLCRQGAEVELLGHEWVLGFERLAVKCDTSAEILCELCPAVRLSPREIEAFLDECLCRFGAAVFGCSDAFVDS